MHIKTQQHNGRSRNRLFSSILIFLSPSLKNFVETEVANDLFPLIRIYKDGRVERLMGTATVSPSLDEKTGVQSKDVAIPPGSIVSARLYIPKAVVGSPQKLPVLVYFHGGGFIIETAWSPTYHNYLNALVAEANIIAISVEYRRAREHPLPTALQFNDHVVNAT
ncbi:probable carboxylesterase 12 [Rhodamnia argentea]|uniref:Probable carboxylesterase 12 n=1 Tax=Rhodamnia argentea TaxID=178133 RepID=A0ABM3HGE4_9MYRT|nr:probable carboxylesterase 12 [Rhodamnia argentea]